MHKTEQETAVLYTTNRVLLDEPPISTKIKAEFSKAMADKIDREIMESYTPEQKNTIYEINKSVNMRNAYTKIVCGIS